MPFELERNWRWAYANHLHSRLVKASFLPAWRIACQYHEKKQDMVRDCPDGVNRLIRECAILSLFDGWFEPICRVLMIKIPQYAIQCDMFFFQIDGNIEKRLADHREELCWIASPIGIDEGVFHAPVDISAQAIIFPVHNY